MIGADLHDCPPIQLVAYGLMGTTNFPANPPEGIPEVIQCLNLSPLKFAQVCKVSAFCVTISTSHHKSAFHYGFVALMITPDFMMVFLFCFRW
ncbi:MAG: hypothetical protein ABF969_05750, partial [Sporolactobacillus sp.]